jgi:hypothetical protein
MLKVLESDFARIPALLDGATGAPPLAPAFEPEVAPPAPVGEVEPVGQLGLF